MTHDSIMLDTQEITSNTDPEKIDSIKQDGIVITFTSPTGGSGKTINTLMTATTLAQSSKKAYEMGQTDKPLSVVVVDLDVLDGQLGYMFGQRLPTTLDVSVYDLPVDKQHLQDTLVYHPDLGVHALLAPQQADLVSPEFYRDAIRQLKTMFDVVVLDTAVCTDDYIKAVALPEADAIVLVTRFSVSSLASLERWTKTVVAPESEGGYGVPRGKLGVVINHVDNPRSVDKEKFSTALDNIPIIEVIPSETVAVTSAVNNNHLADLVYHKTLGSVHFSLAKKIARTRGFTLLPLVADK